MLYRLWRHFIRRRQRVSFFDSQYGMPQRVVPTEADRSSSDMNGKLNNVLRHLVDEEEADETEQSSESLGQPQPKPHRPH